MKRNNLNSCMSKTQFAQNNCVICVELIWPSSDSLIHVRRRSLSGRNMTKETKEIPMNVFSTRLFVLNRADPVKPLNSYSAQIVFDITI